MSTSRPPSDIGALADELRRVLGQNGWLEGADAEFHGRDWLGRHCESPLGVARPASTTEVAEVMNACFRHGVALVPQGGNTGLCAGGVPGFSGSVVLSLARMAAIGTPDHDSGTILVEGGVVLARLHEALEGTGLMFPLHLGAEGSACIGGLIGTNAGGSWASRYGMMSELVLGLEVVLPDGSVWNGLRSVQKDNAGYGLRRLFCGSEGTLGVVTRASLRLWPELRQRASALLAIPDVEALVAFGTLARAEAGELLIGLEFFSDFGVDMVLAHMPGIAFPLETRGPFYLLVELACSSARVPLMSILEDILERGMSAGLVSDGAIAVSEAQRLSFWQLREEQPEGQRLEGAQLKHDISVPPGRIGHFLAEGEALCAQILPGVRFNPFGHLGDGNIHYNLSPPRDGSFADAAADIAVGLARLADGMGGSFAAEHGLGRTKVSLADAVRPKVERDMMARLNLALDPKGLMNPGAVVSGERRRPSISTEAPASREHGPGR